MKQKTILMTEGSIPKSMFYFFIPIFIGQLFQQLYNIVDSIIVGNHVGDNALAAVTSTGPINFLFIGFVSGIFIGSGVLISRYFGAKRIEDMSKSIHTSIAFSIVCGVVLTLIGVLFIPTILRIMNTPSEVINESITYLRIIFLGSIFTVSYNCANGIYQAVGDTKRPLYFLMVACFINVVLDLLFVMVFEMGVAGAALATVIGQSVSAFLAYYFLFKTNDIYKVKLKEIKFHKGFIMDIINYGLPAGIQNCVISLANLVMQSNINGFGNLAMAGSGSYSRIEGLAFIPVTSFTFAITTFVSQNLGANETQRAKKGAIFGICTSIAIAQAFGFIIFIFAPIFINLFNSNPEVIAFGVTRAKTISLFYFLMAFSHGASAVLRGAGKSIIPMFTMLVCWCVLRVIYVTITLKYIFYDIQVIFSAYPLTWGLSATFLLFMLKYSNWNKPANIMDEENNVLLS